jgi:DMSO/TMAO reductase YedYZ molybdopterin-dependent catalytic subunit
LKKTFARIAITITTTLVIFSLAYTSSSPANTAAADTEANPAVTEWPLNVTGLVENPLKLSWTEIFAMPKTTVDAAIICVDFPDTVVTQGNWTGVKLRTLLEEAKPSPDAIKVAFYANDGYSTDLPIATTMQDNIIVAYEKDGAPLNDLRLVVPNKWGYKWIRQLTRIELVNYNFLGYWEGAGYSDEANVAATSTPDLFTPSLPNISAPSRSPTTPETSPSSAPSPSPPPITSPVPFQPTPTPDPSGGMSIPTDVVYTIAASVIVVILALALLFVRKRK